MQWRSMNMAQFKINHRVLEQGKSTYFIADIAANHDGSIDRAIDLIGLAQEAGADCAKFQHFEAKSIVSDVGFKQLGTIQTHQSGWAKSVAQVYDEYHTRREWDEQLLATCKEVGIDFMTTPYNLAAVEYFGEKMAAFKVGSGDITYEDILKAISATKKPVFLATGASDMDDIERAVALLDSVPLCIMQCNTNYTGSLENFKYVNLNVLRTFKIKYPNIILGLSDHTPGHSAVLGAVALGAVAIEKHFTDDNARVGPDHQFALDPVAWSEMVLRTKELELAMGDGCKRVEENEKNTYIVQRRAIRLSKQVSAGHILSRDDLEFLRPCPQGAITPMEIENVIGKRLNIEKAQGDSISWQDLTS